MSDQTCRENGETGGVAREHCMWGQMCRENGETGGVAQEWCVWDQRCSDRIGAGVVVCVCVTRVCTCAVYQVCVFCACVEKGVCHCVCQAYVCAVREYVVGVH